MKINRFAYLLLMINFLSSAAEAQKKPDSLNACMIVKHRMDLKFIQRNAKQIMSKSEDDCVLSLVQKIADSTFKKDNKDYFLTLSAITKASDGYVSEYLDEVGEKLFYENFKNLFSFIFKKNSKFETPLEKLTIESIGLAIQDKKDKEEEKRLLSEFISKQRKKYNLSSDQWNYLQKLNKKIIEFSEM